MGTKTGATGKGSLGLGLGFGREACGRTHSHGQSSNGPPHMPSCTVSRRAGATHGQFRIQKQIGTLYSFFPNSVRVLQADSVYEVPLTVGPSRTLVAIRIGMPSGFPDTAPVITVAPALSHRWVSHEMRVVGHEALATWNRSFSVGKIVKDIEIEFNLRPPTLFAPSATTLKPIQQQHGMPAQYAKHETHDFPEISYQR